MDVQLYQIVGGLGAMLFLILSIRQFLGGHIRVKELFFWSLFWLFTLVLSIFPDPISHMLANTLGIKSNLNAIFFLGLGVLFFVQFRLYLVIRRQNEIISALVRKMAIKEDEEKEQQNTESK